MAFFSWKIVGCVLVALHLSAYGEKEERQMFYATCDGVPPEGETLFGGKANCTAEEAEDWPGQLFVPVTETNPMYQVLSQACLYGYILFIAANEIGDGADLLLLSPKFGPLVGSILVPILGAVPDGLMVLFSGLNKETAPKQIKVGVGALAGSTVMLLTLPWFLSIITGRVRIEGHGKDRYATIKRPADADDDWDKMGTPGSFSLFHQGIQLHPAIQENAKLMIKLSFPYYLIQIPAYISEQKYPGDDADSKAAQVEFEKPFVWIGMILSGLGFLYYLYLMWKDSQSDKSDVKQQVIQMNVEMIEKGHLTLRGAMHDFRVEANVAPGKGGLEEGLVGGSQTAI